MVHDSSTTNTPNIQLEVARLVAEYNTDDSGEYEVFRDFEIETTTWGMHRVTFFSDVRSVFFWRDVDEEWQRLAGGVIRIDRGQVAFVRVQHSAVPETFFMLQRTRDTLRIYSMRVVEEST